MSDEQPVHMPVVLHRLTELERRVDAGFTHIDDRLDRLGFVRSDVYTAEKIALRQELETMKADIADARRPGVWAVSTLGAAFIVAIVGAIARLALGV